MRTDPVEMHYSRGALLETVLTKLREAGHDPDSLDPDALATLEEFHTFGRAGTESLAEAAAITKDDHVLDVGCGIAGPGRLLARRFGCQVVGIDLTQEFCDVGTDLTRRVGLTERVEIRRADALDLPFDNAAFSIVWTQHVSMNIEDKPRLYGEMRRVVPAGGRLAFFDILAGPNQPIHFPVPWAGDNSMSFLASALETQAMVAAAGFRTRIWEDTTAEALGFYDELSRMNPSTLPPLGIHLLIPNMAEKGANLRRNAEEGRIIIVRCVADAV